MESKILIKGKPIKLEVQLGHDLGDFIGNRKTVLLTYYIKGEKRTKKTHIYFINNEPYKELKKWLKKKKTQIKKEVRNDPTN